LAQNLIKICIVSHWGIIHPDISVTSHRRDAKVKLNSCDGTTMTCYLDLYYDTFAILYDETYFF